MEIIKSILIRPVEILLHLKGLLSKKDGILFLPHPQMCIYDHYDLINYKSDSTLSFLHYILTNNLLLNRHLILIIADEKEIDRLNCFCEHNYPDRRISIYALIHDDRKGLFENILRRIRLQNIACRCTHIFASRTYSVFQNTLVKTQLLVNLGYYPAPFKRDVYLPMNNYKPGKITDGKRYDYYITNSEVSKCLILPAFAIQYNKYLNLGMCRNDNLLDDADYTELRSTILSDISYKVDRIILYTPTHRDHFDNGVGIAQTILGFDIDMNKFGGFLQEKNVLIICKLHPKLHPDKLNQGLPQSIRVHSSNTNYGLAELMRISDALMTDYTSGYFDYLLLDKPVIFNFFDFEEFNSTRGMTYEPIETIMAGDVITDEKSLYHAISNLEDNRIKYKEKRKILKDLFFTYHDANSCRRVFDFFFQPNK